MPRVFATCKPVGAATWRVNVLDAATGPVLSIGESDEDSLPLQACNRGLQLSGLHLPSLTTGVPALLCRASLHPARQFKRRVVARSGGIETMTQPISIIGPSLLSQTIPFPPPHRPPLQFLIPLPFGRPSSSSLSLSCGSGARSPNERRAPRPVALRVADFCFRRFPRAGMPLRESSLPSRGAPGLRRGAYEPQENQQLERTGS